MSAQPRLVFIENGHRYLLDGVEVPSVTQVLQPLSDYSKVPPAVLDHARQIGVAVHRACTLWDAEDLVVETLDPRLGGYLAAWQRFRAETGFVVELAEQPVYSLLYRCAGTFDRVGVFTGMVGKPRALLEIKTTADFMPSFGPQLAGYHQLLRDSGLMDRRLAATLQRYAVQLREDGSYRLQTYIGPEDFRVFTSCLLLFHWRQRHDK